MSLGLSYVYAATIVPRMLATVLTTVCATPEPGGCKHVRRTSEVQIVVAQSVSPILTVGVVSYPPKFLPRTNKGLLPAVHGLYDIV